MEPVLSKLAQKHLSESQRQLDFKLVNELTTLDRITASTLLRTDLVRDITTHTREARETTNEE